MFETNDRVLINDYINDNDINSILNYDTNSVYTKIKYGEKGFGNWEDTKINLLSNPCKVDTDFTSDECNFISNVIYYLRSNEKKFEKLIDKNMVWVKINKKYKDLLDYSTIIIDKYLVVFHIDLYNNLGITINNIVKLQNIPIKNQKSLFEKITVI